MAFMLQHMIVYNNGDEKHKMYKIFSPETTNRAATSNLQSLIAPQKNPHRMKSEEYRDCTGRPHRRPSSNAFCVCVCVPLLFQYIIRTPSVMCMCLCVGFRSKHVHPPYHPSHPFVYPRRRTRHTYRVQAARLHGCTETMGMCVHASIRAYVHVLPGQIGGQFPVHRPRVSHETAHTDGRMRRATPLCNGENWSSALHTHTFRLNACDIHTRTRRRRHTSCR